MWKELMKAIGEIAPSIASLLGGPAWRRAVEGLCSIFGLNPHSSEDQILEAFRKATPEILDSYCFMQFHD